ncbi:MAG: hypothetical protein KA314_03740 [Chloroflexi bacterium]|nr:hypothetical protein [Chloroflexota bacterium]MBP8054926.1 hypothetical protein [Chloroflexota bacterium]
MQLINRGVVVVKPKQPFVDWLNQLPDAEEEEPFTIAGLHEDCTVLLIPDFPSLEEMEAFINPLKPDLFEHELANFWEDPQQWPDNLSARIFDEWFDLEAHSMVYDTASTELIAEEDE